MTPRRKKKIYFKGISERQWRVLQFLKAKPYKQARWEELRDLVPTRGFLDNMVKRGLLKIKGCNFYYLPAKSKRSTKGGVGAKKTA